MTVVPLNCALSTAAKLTAGVTLAAITVELVVPPAYAVAAGPGGETINLATTLANGKFYNGSTPISSITIPAGSSSASFTYLDTKAGIATLTATVGTSAQTQAETVNPAAASTLAFASSAQTLAISASRRRSP